MRTMTTLLSTSLAAMLVALLPATSARAQFVRTWVASNGTDNAGCGDHSTPCASFSFALGHVDDNGEINCVDSGSFNNNGDLLIIDKSVTIDCSGVLGSLGGNVTGISINISGPGIVVRLRNLSFAGRLLNSKGIDFVNGAVLFVEHCQFYRYNQGGGIGIMFEPSAAARLVVTDSSFYANGDPSGIGGGIVINPQSGGSALVSLDRVTVADNNFGIVADGSNSTAGIAMVIKNSTVHRNPQGGIVATTSSAPIGVMVTNTSSVSNNIGIRATGPGVTVRADSATVMHNGTGLVVNNGAALLSAGNNMVEANGVNGAFSGPVALK